MRGGGESHLCLLLSMVVAESSSFSLSYVLPLRLTSAGPAQVLTPYIAWLGARAELIVVDGSDPEIFARNAELWSRHATHVAPDAHLDYDNGKVNGVTTGVRLATNDQVVLADDDVRYDQDGLTAMTRLLEEADLVIPQNYFDPLVWHAMWDTSRSLLNRAFGYDFPGTLGIRRSRFMEMGGYDGNVLFENLELIRTVSAAGGVVRSAPDLFVRRLPPTSHHFWSQRIRQAYDDFALPGRMFTWLAIGPLVARLTARRRMKALLASLLLGVGVAEVGRRKNGGARVFPARCALFAPLWLLERGMCAWLALIQRNLRGGVVYRGRVIERAANAPRRSVAAPVARDIPRQS